MANIELVRDVEDVRSRIEQAIAAGETLLTETPTSEVDLPEFRGKYLAWESRTSAVLDASFKTAGFMTVSPKDEFTATAISLLDLKLSSTTLPQGRVPEVIADVGEKLRVLRSIEGRLDIYEEGASQAAVPPWPESPDAPIFLVHGHNLARREIVRRFLEKATDRAVIVLAEQPGRGQDLLGKLLTSAEQASFAVVLLTPDDLGGASQETIRPRARQNVVFELGLFIGLLGRDKVAALNDSSVELPTDFSGVGYIPIEGDSWQIELVRELRAAGIAASVDAVL